jgi:hypothetical protein
MFKNQNEKDAAVVAQQVVVDNAVDEAKVVAEEKLAELKAEEVE